MSKIVGVTVGTPLSPQTLKEKLKPIISVNGIGPDESGNVNVEIPDFDENKLTEAINTALEQAKTSGEFDGKDGTDGKDGEDGKDGTSVTVTNVQTSTADGGSNIVTFSDGKTLTVKNGSKGSAGAKGDKGDTGETGAAGKDGADGKTPVKGTDYYTAADKAEMVNAVLAALPTWTGGSY